MNIREPLLEHLKIIREQNQKTLQVLETSLAQQNNENFLTNNEAAIKAYKTSLTTLYIDQTSYIPRDIYTNEDQTYSSIESLLKNKRKSIKKQAYHTIRKSRIWKNL